MSFKKGYTPWNKGKIRTWKAGSFQKGNQINKGRPPWNKGILMGKQSPEVIEKRVSQLRGENHPFYGKHRSKETIRKISENRKGIPAWNRGIPCDDAMKKRISKKLTGWKHPSTCRCMSCKAHRGELVGKKALNWQGGKSYEPYSHLFNQQLKDKIRVRDNFICQKCGTPELELNERLRIHHIDYDKQNCKEDNLIALCNRCNSVVNGNREYWKEYFINKLTCKKQELTSKEAEIWR